MKPFYQGKLDTFCAIYAVLNALRLTHCLRTLKARDILNETLMAIANTPGALRAVLEQETDYCGLVETMLNVARQRFPLEIQRPFADGEHPGEDDVWQCCRQWLVPNNNRAVLFRFLRHVVPDQPPTVRHWTVADSVQGDIMHLFDCSHEAEAILNVRRESFVTDLKLVSKSRLLYIQPDTLRLLRPSR